MSSILNIKETLFFLFLECVPEWKFQWRRKKFLIAKWNARPHSKKNQYKNRKITTIKVKEPVKEVKKVIEVKKTEVKKEGLNNYQRWLTYTAGLTKSEKEVELHPVTGIEQKFTFKQWAQKGYYKYTTEHPNFKGIPVKIVFSLFNQTDRDEVTIGADIIDQETNSTLCKYSNTLTDYKDFSVLTSDTHLIDSVSFSAILSCQLARLIGIKAVHTWKLQNK